MNATRPTTGKMRDRIHRWEMLTRRNWDEATRRYALLAAKYGITITDPKPDDPRFPILDRADSGATLYAQDFKIMDLFGVSDFQSRFAEVSNRCTDWEKNTGKSWNEEQNRFMRLASRYGIGVENYSPSSPLYEALKKCDSGEWLNPIESRTVAEAAETLDHNYCLNRRNRIVAWERNKSEDWEAGSQRFEHLSRWYDIQLDDFSPDNSLYDALRNIAEGSQLSTSDREVLLRFGGPSLAARLLHQKVVDDWEEQTGKSWTEEVHEFKRLCRRYNIPNQEISPKSVILEILKRLDKGEEIGDKELHIIASSGAPELATNYEMIRVLETRYRVSEQPEVLARISSLWNQCGVPSMALEVTDRVFNPDHSPIITLPTNVEAMLLTTRGASLRRLNRLEEGRICAERALHLRNNDGHAYCLIGAIDIQEGNYEKGEENFLKCERLRPGVDADNWRKGAIRLVRHPEDYAAYLYHKDPTRFDWAYDYLRSLRFPKAKQ